MKHQFSTLGPFRIVFNPFLARPFYRVPTEPLFNSNCAIETPPPSPNLKASSMILQREKGQCYTHYLSFASLSLAWYSA